jgi:hypothetical protein
LRQHRDPRVLGYGEIFLATPYYSNTHPHLHQIGAARIEEARARLAADDSANGASNLLEIGLAGDLQDGIAPPVAAALRGGEAVFTYTRQKDRFAMAESVWWSGDLSTWSQEGLVFEMVADHGAYETVEARLPVPPGPTAVFFRVEVAFDASNLD